MNGNKTNTEQYTSNNNMLSNIYTPRTIQINYSFNRTPANDGEQFWDRHAKETRIAYVDALNGPRAVKGNEAAKPVYRNHYEKSFCFCF